MKRILMAEAFGILNKLFGWWRLLMKVALWVFGVYVVVLIAMGYAAHRSDETWILALRPAAWWLAFFIVYRVTDYLFLALLGRLAAGARR